MVRNPLMGIHRALLAAALALSAAALAGPAAAQAPGAAVTGQVLDHSTGQPVSAAHVWFKNRQLSSYADAQGRFRVEGVPPGTHVVRVERIGYQGSEMSWEVGESGGEFTVQLTPDAVMLEALRVQVDELARRRNSAPVAVRLVERHTLVAAPEPTVLEMLTGRGLRPVPCSAGQQACARIRGQMVRVRLFVDEVPVMGGLGALDTYKPRDIYLVEIYGGGSMVRVYTNAYMEDANRRKIRPIPTFY
jgi:hypothetical protein